MGSSIIIRAVNGQGRYLKLKKMEGERQRGQDSHGRFKELIHTWIIIFQNSDMKITSCFRINEVSIRWEKFELCLSTVRKDND